MRGADELSWAISAAEIGLVVSDASGRLLMQNETAMRWMGDDTGVLREIQQRARTCATSVLLDKVAIGQLRLAVRCVPCMTDGDFSGTTCVLWDVSLAEMAAEELAGLKNLGSVLETVFELSYDGLIVIDQQGTVKMFNKAYSDYLQVPQSHAVGRHVYETIPNSRLPDVMVTREAEIGHVHTYPSGQRAVVMRMPIRHNGVIVGAVGKIMFGDVDQVKTLAGRIARMEEELEYYRGELRRVRGAKYGIENIIGDSEQISQVKRLIVRAADSSSTVLITGETGTGKELVAHAIHSLSSRSHGPFVRVNCASIPESVAESELFGYADGAFTGAKKGGRIGKFEVADGGTAFLDEVGDMPESIQAKILRVLQEREIERIGENKVVSVDVRIIAATNKDLTQLISEGAFRADLYYRLNVFSVPIPPLRARRDDIEPLAEFILRGLERDFGRRLRLSAEAKTAMREYSWPGNVRELENSLERAANVAEGPEIGVEDLPVHILRLQGSARPAQAQALVKATYKAERAAIEAALRHCSGNKAGAARVLQIDRSTLYKKMSRYGISTEGKVRT